jgi:multiple sugar transport system substrate-binding protein/sn-glycerol 3-phosphate transport system substrate-binding protein
MLLLLIVGLVMSLGVVSAQEDLSGVDPAGQTVVYWHQYNGGAQLETIDALIAEFNESNEWGITVEGVSVGDYNDLRTQMNAGITSGELPNLVAGFGNDMISYGLDGAVADLDLYMRDPSWGFTGDEIGDLNESVLDGYIFDALGGIRGAWPNQLSAQVFVVNMGMLNDLGFDAPPHTVEEMMDVACAAAAADGIEGYPIKGGASDLESFVASQGGVIFADGAYTFTNDAVIAALQMYQDIYNNDCGYIPDSQFGNTDDFAIGLNPMASTSSAGLPFIAGGMESAGYETEWIVTTHPGAADVTALQVFSPAIAIVPTSAEADLASWLFIKFLASEGSQRQWTENTNYFPINNVVAGSLDELEAANPRFAEANALLSDQSVTIYSSPQQLSYGAVRGLMDAAVADVTVNGRDVAEVAQELEDAANATHEEMQP